MFFPLLDKEYIFPHYMQYLLDLSKSDDKDSDWSLEEEVLDATEPNHCVMDSGLVSEVMDDGILVVF